MVYSGVTSSLDNESILEADEIGFVEIIRFYVSMYL